MRLGGAAFSSASCIARLSITAAQPPQTFRVDEFAARVIIGPEKKNPRKFFYYRVGRLFRALRSSCKFSR
jgi:hypothetical protein